MKPKILIVDDEKPLRDTLARWFKPTYECLLAADADQALAIVKSTPDLALMISDVRMPGKNGVELLKEARETNPNLAAIMLTAYGTVDLAVEAMKDGACDFFQKPVTDLKAFEARVAQAIHTGNLERQVKNLKSQLDAKFGLEAFTGNSPAMERVYKIVRQAAPSAANVLVEGPSGTGKELVAHAIHALSPRAKGPFVAVECAALSSSLLESELFGYEPNAFTGAAAKGRIGRFEAANGGTLFLDEIGEIDPAMQVKLLRALESRAIQRVGGNESIAVDFRLVAATNRDLAAMVAAGTFREDLYYRLNVIDIHMPALKDRPGDVALLAARFLKEFSAANGNRVTAIAPELLKALEAYPWPGNVRQLRNAIEKMVVLAEGDRLTLADLPAEFQDGMARFQDGRARFQDGRARFQDGRARFQDGRARAPREPQPTPPSTVNLQPPLQPLPQPTTNNQQPTTTLADFERERILAAIAQCGGNKSKAADMLGISRRTIHRKLDAWKQH